MSEGGWIGLASLFLTGLLALANRIVSNRHDDKIRTLETAQKECQRESAECKEQRAADRAALAAATKALAARDERDRAELQKQIDELKKKQ